MPLSRDKREWRDMNGCKGNGNATEASRVASLEDLALLLETTSSLSIACLSRPQVPQTRLTCWSRKFDFQAQHNNGVCQVIRACCIIIPRGSPFRVLLVSGRSIVAFAVNATSTSHAYLPPRLSIESDRVSVYRFPGTCYAVSISHASVASAFLGRSKDSQAQSSE